MSLDPSHTFSLSGDALRREIIDEPERSSERRDECGDDCGPRNSQIGDRCEILCGPSFVLRRMAHCMLVIMHVTGLATAQTVPCAGKADSLSAAEALGKGGGMSNEFGKRPHGQKCLPSLSPATEKRMSTNHP